MQGRFRRGNPRSLYSGLPEAKLGDYVIVHAGFALSILSEQEAQETLDVLRELAMVEEEIGSTSRQVKHALHG